MDSLTNKSVVITGGNSGIGYAAAREFKSRGAKVVITGKRQSAVDEVANKLGVTGLLADQADLNQLDKLVAEMLKPCSEK